jgi:GGDEF domain-containing protein
VLSLFERAAGLFSTLAVEPLAERLIEGLCLETRAQSGVLWVAEERGSNTLHLVGVRGLVRVDGEPASVDLDEVVSAWCPELAAGRATVATLPEDAHGVEALYVPIRVDGATIGVARLSDKLGDESFGESDRAMAEKFCEFGGIAMNNAMRFHALERRSLRDPETCTYTRAYFEDAVRNEIQKANRFSHRFSILRLEVGDPAQTRSRPGARSVDQMQAAQEIARQIASALRATDLLASDDAGAYYVLLPQTDALGASILTQRIRKSLGSPAPSGRPPEVRSASTTFPVDGTQLDALVRVLEERIEQSRHSLLATRSDLVRSRPLDPMFDRILELGAVMNAEVEGQILRFVLEDVVRRPGDRGVLFLSPGARWLPELLETLHEIRSRRVRTEIVVLAEGEENDSESNVKWIAKSSLDARRPFVVYFGDGPAFAMIGQVANPNERAPIFETADRNFVEHLAFELQRELGVLISV